MNGYGYNVYYVQGSEPDMVHQQMAATLEVVIDEIKSIQKEARTNGFTKRPLWPMIVMRTPKGWTCPKMIDGQPVEDSFRSHQVPLAELATKPEHIKILESWMLSYKPDELFDATGKLKRDIAALAPDGLRRMSANPHANGGLLLKDLKMPDFRQYAIKVSIPGTIEAEATRVMGQFIRDVMKLNAPMQNFRVMGPDEFASNRLSALFEVTKRISTAEILPLMIFSHTMAE